MLASGIQPVSWKRPVRILEIKRTKGKSQSANAFSKACLFLRLIFRCTL
jgi:hypothetical protein